MKESRLRFFQTGFVPFRLRRIRHNSPVSGKECTIMMKSLKRAISVLAVVALLCTSTALIPATAADEAPAYTKLIAGSHAVVNKGTIRDDLGVGFGSAAQSEAAIQKFLDPNASPYLQYAVEAPDAGAYTLKLGLRSSVTADTRFAVIVNDGAPQFLKPGGGEEELSFSAQLVKGRNLVLVTNCLEDHLANYIVHDSLSVPAPLTGLNAKELTRSVRAVDMTYFFKYPNRNNGELGGVNDGEYGPGKINVDVTSLSRENLLQVASFALTVTAPADGYYEVSPVVHSGATAGGVFQVGMLVNGDNTGRHPIFGKAEGNREKTSNRVYLRKGDNTLAFTLAMPGTYGNAWKWTNYYDIQLSGGVTLSDCQENPVSGAKRAKSAVYPVLNMATVNQNEGDVRFDRAAQSFADIRVYLDPTYSPYLEYFVDAQEAGAYILTVGLKQNAQPGRGFAAIVNNGTPQRISSETNASQVSFEAELVKGRNTILLTCMVADGSGGYMVHDYLEVPAGLTPVNARPLETTRRAMDMRYSHNYPNKNAELGELGGSNDSWYSEKLVNITAANLSLGNYTNISSFSVTVEAPAEGFYEVSPEVSMGGNEKHLIGVLVNGKNPGVYPVNKGGSRRYTNYRAHLRQGRNVLTFTMAVPAPAGAGYSTGWVWTNFYNIKLNGGLTFADPENEIEPREAFITILEAEEYGERNLFMTVPAGEQFSGGKALGGARNTNLQTFEEMESRLDPDRTPYVEFKVVAPEAGIYEIGAGLQSGVTEHYIPRVALVVNGEVFRYQHCGNLSNKGPKTVSPANAMRVELKKGENTILVTSITREDAEDGNNGWVNVDYLYVEKALTGVDREEPVRFEAEDAEHFGMYRVAEEPDKTYLGFGNLENIHELYLTTEDFTLDTFDLSPYFAMTVTAPEDGVYKLSVGANICDRKFVGGAMGKIALLVDGVRHIVPFDSTGDNSKRTWMDTRLELTKGDHVLVFSGILYNTFETYSVDSWINYDFVELRGGLTVADTQQNPLKQELKRYEAEDWGAVNLYQRDRQNDASYSGNNGVGYGQNTTGQTREELLRDGLSERMSFVRYTVVAPEEGEYPIRLRMEYGMSGKVGMETAQFGVLVNGGDTQCVEFRIETGGKKFFTVPLTVHLAKGKNTITVTGTTRDTCIDSSNDVWLNHDYIAVDPALTIEKNQRLEAESQAYMNYLVVRNSRYSNENAMGDAELFYVIRDNITYDTLNAENLENTPHVNYKVTAPSDGTYRITVGAYADALYYGSFYGQNDLETGYLTCLVNGGQKQKISYYVIGTTDREVEVHLKKGENTITIVSQLAEQITWPTHPTYDALKMVDLVQDYIELPPELRGVVEGALNPGADDVDTGLSDGEKIPSSNPSGIPETGENTARALLALGLLPVCAATVVVSRKRRNVRK